MTESDLFFDIQDTLIPPVSVAPSRTALVIVDMQYHDAHPDGAFNVAMEKLQPGSMAYFNERTENTTVPAIQKLLTAARQHGLTVVHLELGSDDPDYRDLDARQQQWIKTLEARSGITGIFCSDNPDFRIRDELTPIDGESVVRKTTFGAFNGSNIDAVLTEHGVDSLIVAGISTNCCVEGTVRDAAEKGYGCVVISEATADYDEYAHHASLRALAFNHCRVVATVDTVIDAIAEGGEI
jgi:nicotinamidase-related amidase